MPNLGVAVHWTVNDPPADHAGCVALVAQIAQLHASKGSSGHTFYNWLFCNHGQRIKGRGWDRQSGANGTSQANRDWWACSWIGGPGHKPSSAALAVLTALIREAPGANAARPHSDFYATACPGPDLTAFARAYSPSAPAPIPVPQEEDDVYAVQSPGRGWFLISGNSRLQLTQAQFQSLAPKVVWLEVDAAQFDALVATQDSSAGAISRLAGFFARLWPKKAERAGARVRDRA